MKGPLLNIIFTLCFFTALGQDYCRNNVVNHGYHESAKHLMTTERAKNTSTLVIPVVFHIVYNAAIENVPDSLIFKQLDQLNRDFRRENADSGNTPAPFKSLAAGMNIRFCLANTTPSASPTNGINRVFTNKTFFKAPPDYITPDSLKHANLGGADAWNTAQYLNIWIGNVTNLSGYAAPPGNMMASEDGVGVNYKTLGTSNSAPPYNKFRTITHEVAHFFGLKHIWGDDGGSCAGTDYMADTPNQANYTPGNASNTCTPFPLFDGCTTGGNGIMYMNYMDYCNDVCRNMFTNAQVNYMNATINCCRTGFLSATLASCNEVTAVEKKFAARKNTRIYPNPAAEKIFISTDFPYRKITIKNILGYTLQTEENNSELNTSDFSPGIYFIYLDELAAGTFIKQ